MCVHAHTRTQSLSPDSLWPHGLQPTRLLCPWDFPGKNTEVGCHFLLQGIFPTQGSKPCLLSFLPMKVKVTQSCPTLCYPMDYAVHGLLQARILEWVACPFSRGASQPRDQTQVSRIAGGFFTSWVQREAVGNRICLKTKRVELSSQVQEK